MSDLMYISRIGRRMRERGLRRKDLRQRLEARGIRISRGALDRVISERPIEGVRLGVVIPVLEEVGLEFREAFEPVLSREAEERAKVAGEVEQVAEQIYRQVTPESLGASQDDIDAELKEVVTRSRALLRERLPEVFDKRGRPRRKLLEKAIADRLPGRGEITPEEFLKLTARPDAP